MALVMLGAAIAWPDVLPQVEARAYAPDAVADCVPSWRQLPAANGGPAARSGRLVAIDAFEGNVWVLSSSEAQRWNGARWTSIPGSRLTKASYADLDLTAPSDGWAVGTIGRLPLVTHWDGRTWRQVALPGAVRSARGVGPGGARSLRGVSAPSSTSVWAVGSDSRARFSAREPNALGVVLHWNGTTWRRIALPAPVREVRLGGVVALSPRNVWMIGNIIGELGVVLHWKGDRWRTFRLRAPAPSVNTYLNAIIATGGSDVTIVGAGVSGAGRPTNETTGLLFRWTGARWTLRRLHALPSFVDYTAVASTSPTQTWVSANDVTPFRQEGGSELFAAEQRGASTTQLPPGHVIEDLAATKSTVWGAGWIGTGFRDEDIDFDYKDFTPLVIRRGC